MSEKKMEHTPLPWKLGKDGYIRSNEEVVIARVHSMVDGKRTYDELAIESKENSQFIFTACNNFYKLREENDRLLKALKAILWDYEDETATKAREAIAQAEKEANDGR